MRALTVTLNPCIDKTITVNKLEVGGLNRVGKTRIDAGGKGINMGKALKALGAEAVLTGFIAGEDGKKLCTMLNNAELYHDFVIVSGETRTNMKIFDEATGLVTEVNESGFAVSDEEQAAFLSKLELLLRESEILLLGGSLPRGVKSDFYARCADIAKRANVPVLLDADGAALEAGISAKPDIIKPNADELSRLVGKPLNGERDIASAAKTLVDGGVGMVLCSMGASGAVLVSHNFAIRSFAPKIHVQGTVGAGDTMGAAFCYAYYNRKELAQCLAFATAAGTATAAKAGSEVSGTGEANSFLGKVRIEKIKY